MPGGNASQVRFLPAQCTAARRPDWAIGETFMVGRAKKFRIVASVSG
jgi:hypothetical protein